MPINLMGGRPPVGEGKNSSYGSIVRDVHLLQSVSVLV